MKHGHKFLAGALVVAALAAALALLAAGTQGVWAQAGSIIYVDVEAVGRDDGTTWRNAYTDLQDALDEAEPLDQIWVAAGTYKPSHEFIPGDPRSASFQMVNGVAIYGGFAPGEGVTKFDQRDPSAYNTITSGNIGAEASPLDNVYHVFYHPEDLALDDSAILDGFIITGGNADQEDPSGLRGGGMLNEGSWPTLNNITFLDNWAGYGGGIWVGAPYPEEATVVLTNVTFEGNSADDGGAAYIDAAQAIPGEPGDIAFANCIFRGNVAERGGGVFITNGEPDSEATPVWFTNCIFRGNEADLGGGVFITWGEPGTEPTPVWFTNCIFWSNEADLGGGVFITDGELDADTPPIRFTNCTFSANVAESGGGIYVGKAMGPGEGWLEVTNSILWGDTPEEIYVEDPETLPLVTFSDIEGGYDGEGNIDLDPRFVEPDSGDLHLQAGSPCIDFGDSGGPAFTPYDIDGDPRVLDGNGDGWAVVDMGADEFKMPAIWVEIDVTPDVPSNVIKLGSPRRVPVAILSTEEFDAVAEVAPDTVEFAGATHVGFTFVDVNKDGHEDVLLDFRARDMEDLDEHSTEATLTGETFGGASIEGTDEVQVIP